MLRSIGRLVVGFALVISLFQPAWCQSVYPTATLTILGAERSIPGGWDTGTITISFNGYSAAVHYGQFSTPSSIASAFAAEFSQTPLTALPRLCTIGVCAKSSGAAIVFQLSSSTGTFGPVTVAGSSVSFTVDTAAWPEADPAPTISSVAPAPAMVGGIVIISGLNFGQVAGTVTISGISAFQILWTNNVITVTVPSGVATGAVTLTITTSGQLSASYSVTVGAGNQNASCPVI